MWIRGKLSWKKSALVWTEILSRFVNTLTADDKYSRSIMQNFHNNSKRHYPSKQKTFLAFLVAFLKCAWNLEYFEKKGESASQIISEIIDSEKPGYLYVKRSCFRTPFGKEHVNGFRTLLKSAWHHYYPIFSWIRIIFSWKKSALVWTEKLRLFVNT